ncbi:MAG: hemolysin family protein [Candidatus Lernaella stagnicola]|nr:hemolysin family protein [Candidatus Lernaella stagnicola]
MTENDDVPRSPFQRFISFLKGETDHDRFTEEAIEDLEQNGHIDHDESEMMQGILYLDKTTAREVMVPRTEMVCVDRENTIDEIVERALTSGHSRLPVISGDVDNVVGFIHAKDLFRYWGKPEGFRLEEILRRSYTVPESIKLDDLLQEFQARREQIALVIDEFGGTSGLVSIEDILEEIVGEIQDEYDTEDPKAIFADENTLVVPGRFEMDNLVEHFGLEEEPEGEFNTVGGWIFHRLGRVPVTNDAFDIDGFHITIEVASERHIRRARIERIAPVDDED